MERLSCVAVLRCPVECLWCGVPEASNAVEEVSSDTKTEAAEDLQDTENVLSKVVNSKGCLNEDWENQLTRDFNDMIARLPKSYFGSNESLPEVCSGVAEVCSGVAEVCSGVAEVCSGVAEVCSGVAEVCSGVAEVCSGVAEVCSGVAEVCSGVAEVCSGVAEVCSGVAEVCSGVAEVCSGVPDVSNAVEEVRRWQKEAEEKWRSTIPPTCVEVLHAHQQPPQRRVTEAHTTPGHTLPQRPNFSTISPFPSNCLFLIINIKGI
ncbi:uncharacterized protein [Salvelinus alpinus]|uniref:uncharacterized protein n=1 Tax=Salvelinus alpinus TaxID=8036 RepID=UPI0039FCC18D